MADVSNSKLFQIDAGILEVKDACIILVKTEWNAAIVDELEKGCIRELQKHNIRKIITITVPGAVEIPFAIRDYHLQTQKKKKKADAFIALGCVVKGDTPHFDYVCKAVTDKDSFVIAGPEILCFCNDYFTRIHIHIFLF